ENVFRIQRGHGRAQTDRGLADCCNPKRKPTRSRARCGVIAIKSNSVVLNSLPPKSGGAWDRVAKVVPRISLLDPTQAYRLGYLDFFRSVYPHIGREHRRCDCTEKPNSKSCRRRFKPTIPEPDFGLRTTSRHVDAASTSTRLVRLVLFQTLSI